MSQPSGSGRVKRRRVKTEDQIVKEILQLQKLLMKEHKTASLFAYSSKFGLMRFGSDNVVEKFRDESDNWISGFEKGASLPTMPKTLSKLAKNLNKTGENL